MKKLLGLLTASVLGLQLLVMGTAQAAAVEEIKQKHGDVTLNANLMMADGKSYADEMVLLTHGTLTHKERSTYAQLQKNLAANGISSLAINLSLGLSDRSGEYDCAVAHTHKHTDALTEIDFWLNWLTKQGASNVTLMGHSRGGNQTAWYAAENDSNKFNKVILLAPATGEQQSATEYESKYGKTLASVLAKAEKMVAAGKAKSMLKDTDFIYCKKTQVSAEAFVDYYTVKPQFDTPTVLKDIKKPTLVMMGSEDTAVPHLPEKMKAFEGSDTVKMVVIEDADHFFLDFANEDVATAVLEFLE